jgi:hypothetical protein
VIAGNIYEYQVLAQNSGGASAPSQVASVRAGQANLTAFRPQQFQDPDHPTNAPIYTPFAKHAVAEMDEDSTTLGPGIRMNGDDDNGNQIADRYESGNSIPLENDLIEVRVDRVPGQGNMVLETGSNLVLYYTYDKSIPIPNQVGTRTQPLNFVNNSVTVFVEWAAAGHGVDTLQLRNATTLAVLDSVTFHTFHTAVVAFGGDTQVPADPVLSPKNHGVFSTAIELYNQGYDVRMYNEANVGYFTTGTAFDEIVNSINYQGYNNSSDPFGHNGVALFGYSQGAGAVYNLSEALETASNPLNGTIKEVFSVSFTAYIDGIQHVGASAETRRPRLSEFHLNQYQTNGIVHGEPIADLHDQDEEQNVTALLLGHKTVDDDPGVLDLLKRRLKQKVTR